MSAYGYDENKEKVEVYEKEDAYGTDNVTISTSPAPSTGEPNTIYIQIV